MVVNSAVIDIDSQDRNSLTSTFVGRPGLDPGTLGSAQSRPLVSVDVRISWSDDDAIPGSSTDVPTSLLLRLSNWLSSNDFEFVGVMNS